MGVLRVNQAEVVTKEVRNGGRLVTGHIGYVVTLPKRRGSGSGRCHVWEIWSPSQPCCAGTIGWLASSTRTIWVNYIHLK